MSIRFVIKSQIVDRELNDKASVLTDNKYPGV